MMEIAPYSLDDALFTDRDQRDSPRVQIYRYPDIAVVLGHGSKVDVELDVAAVTADKIPVLRRRGGGYSVVLDPGNLVVSVVMTLSGLGGITGAYESISNWLIAGLARSGVAGVNMRGASDLAIGDRKIGGACMYRSRDLLYYTTTLLYAPDLDLVERYLRHPPREPDYRARRHHRDFMGSLEGSVDAVDADDFAARLTAALRGGTILGRDTAIEHSNASTEHFTETTSRARLSERG